MSGHQVFIERLHVVLPHFFTRQEVAKILAGYLTVGTLANLDCKGDGPPKLRRGKKVLYERESFIEWFVARETVDSGAVNHD